MDCVFFFLGTPYQVPSELCSVGLYGAFLKTTHGLSLPPPPELFIASVRTEEETVENGK